MDLCITDFRHFYCFRVNFEKVGNVSSIYMKPKLNFTAYIKGSATRILQEHQDKSNAYVQVFFPTYFCVMNF